MASPNYRRGGLLPALPAFPFVFGFCFRDRLPLHIRWTVCAATRQRFDVIDDVALAWASRLAGGWTGVIVFERGDGPVVAVRCRIGQRRKAQ